MSFIKNILIFLAGATCMHTLSHIFLPYYIDFPVVMKGFTLTSAINTWAILSSAAVTVVLLWLAAWINR